MISLLNEVVEKTMKNRVEEKDIDTSGKRISFILLLLLSHWIWLTRKNSQADKHK